MWQTKSAMGTGQDAVQFLKSGKAGMTMEKFNLFWNEGVSIGYYILELVKYYCEIEKAKKASSISIEATVGTLYFLALSGCYDPGDHGFQANIEEAKSRWSSHRHNHESFNPLIDEIMVAVLNIANNPDDHIHLVFSHSLMLSPKIESFSEIAYINYFGQQFKIQTPQEILAYASKGFYYLSQNPRFCILDKGEFILAYSFIKNYLSTLGYVPVSILDLFHRKIQEMIISLRANDYKHVQSSLLPLLHMLKNLLIRYPIISYDSMDALIIDLDIIRRWPIPYGSSADSLLKLIIQELKCPGSAIRYKLREDFPTVDVHVPIFETNDVREHQFLKSIAYFIIDSAETLETSWLYRMSFFNKKYRKERIVEMVEKIHTDSSINLTSVYAHASRCLTVLFAFSLYTEVQITDISHFAGLSTENVFSIYKRILKIAEEIESDEIDVARSKLEWCILELYSESKNLKSDRANPLTEPLFVYLSEFEVYFPRVPLHHLSIIDLTQVDSSVKTIEETEYLINESTFSSVDEPIIDIIRRGANITPSRSFPVKIALTGSDSITHKFLRNYVRALTGLKSSAELDVRVYVVPTYGSENTLAKYLASNDPWYLQHVYLPFYFRPWLPRLDTKMDMKHVAKKDHNIHESLIRALALDPVEAGGLNEKSLPIAYSEVLVQDYLSEAAHIVPINIYKIRCFKNDLLRPDEIIPMALYLEIGAPVAVKRIQETNPSLKGKSFLEVVDSKVFRYRSTSLMLQMSQMDLLGNPCGLDEGVIKNIYSLTIANVPREFDRGMQAIPQAEWIELSFIEREAAEQEASLLKSIKNKKIKEPQSKLNIAINSLYSNLHVSSGRISATEANEFEIIVDGVLYGPYKQIIIEPWRNDDVNQIVLPIYAFLDTEN